MRPRNHDAKTRSWLWSKWFMGVILGIFLLLGFSLVKEFLRNREINSQIDALHQEIADLQQSNQANTEFVEYLKTDLYLEEQARIKLGLKSGGEKMIVLQQEDKEEGGIFSRENNGGGRTKNSTDHVLNWIDYFWRVDS